MPNQIEDELQALVRSTTELKAGESTTSEIVSNGKLLEAGAYFGHKKAQWNPKMKPYILGVKKGVHVIDIQKTKRTLEFAYTLIKKFAEKNATFIFVGTRRQAKETIKNNALRTNSFFVSERWLGGTLTNNRTIFNSVRTMFDLEKKAESNFASYTKKEGVLFAKRLAKLQKNLAGIKSMRAIPQVMIIADPTHDEIAVKEARRLGVKVIGIVDTNVDPTIVDVAIPANDDSVKSVTLVITILADAIAAAKGGVQAFAFQGDAAIKLPDEIREERQDRRGRPGQFGGSRRFFKRDEQRDDSRPTRTMSSRSESASAESQGPKERSIIDSTPDYEAMTVTALRELAKNKGLKVTSIMKKGEIVEMLKGKK